MKTQETQLLQVRKHLARYKRITSWTAIERYRITRLSHYIWVLRNKGMNIESQRKVNNGKSYVVYIKK